jgi:triosephosphate isomerase
MRTHWGDQVAEQVRIIYGGSVTPEHAATLLQCMDGLGASTRGRDPRTFADIMQQIARVKLGTP